MNIKQVFSAVKTHNAGEMTDPLWVLAVDDAHTNINMQELGGGNFRIYFDLPDNKGVQRDIAFVKGGICKALERATKAYFLREMGVAC